MQSINESNTLEYTLITTNHVLFLTTNYVFKFEADTGDMGKLQKYAVYSNNNRNCKNSGLVLTRQIY